MRFAVYTLDSEFPTFWELTVRCLQPGQIVICSGCESRIVRAHFYPNPTIGVSNLGQYGTITGFQLQIVRGPHSGEVYYLNCTPWTVTYLSGCTPQTSTYIGQRLNPGQRFLIVGLILKMKD